MTATSAIIAWPGKWSGWPDRLPPSEKAKLAPGDGAANASSGRATLAARPQSSPRTGGPLGAGSGDATAVDAGADGEVVVGPQAPGVIMSARAAIAATGRR